MSLCVCLCVPTLKKNHHVLSEVKLKWIVLLNILLLTSTSQKCCYSDTGDNYFTTDFFLSVPPPLPPLSFLPPSKPFHSCRVLVLHKLPGGILNQSPATKGESLWLIAKRRRAHAAHRQTHREAEGGWSLRARKLTPLQKTWQHMRTRRRKGGGGSANLGEACIGHPSYSLSAHYLVINRGAVLKEGGINQLSRVNVLQPHYEPWVAL